MLGEQIEVVFENGVFRPLQPVHLPEHQRVTLVLPASGEAARNGTEEDDSDEEVGYLPLPLQPFKTIRVKVRHVGRLPLVPYPVEAEDLEPE